MIAAGQSSTAQSVTITNSSSYAIGSVTLAASAPFNITQNGCTGSLAAGANCTASVVFSPSAGGSATGSLTVSSAAVATPATVALSGTGFDFTVAFSGPSSQTVAAGQQANYTLVLTPIGSSGTFTFACGTLPYGRALPLQPRHGNAQFRRAGQRPGRNLHHTAPVRVSENRGLAAGPAIPASGALCRSRAACCFCHSRFAGDAKSLRLVVLAAVLACGISSCTSSGGGTGGGGGSGGSGGGSGTPAGTYTIPVTVTANGISHTVDWSSPSTDRGRIYCVHSFASFTCATRYTCFSGSRRRSQARPAETPAIRNASA